MRVRVQRKQCHDEASRLIVSFVIGTLVNQGSPTRYFGQNCLSAFELSCSVPFKFSAAAAKIVKIVNRTYFWISIANTCQVSPHAYSVCLRLVIEFYFGCFSK